MKGTRRERNELEHKVTGNIKAYNPGGEHRALMRLVRLGRSFDNTFDHFTELLAASKNLGYLRLPEAEDTEPAAAALAADGAGGE